MPLYNNEKVTQQLANGKLGPKVYRPSIIPYTKPDPRDTYFYSREGDRLDLLANEFYNNVTLWWIIAAANNLGKGTLSIQPGKLIRVPFRNT